MPVDLIQPDWVCYAGGVGEDITFDREMIERFGCRVFAFDPTPRAAAHVEQHAEGLGNFRFLPVGLWSEDTVLRFYAPRDPAHVSHSIVNLQETDAYFEAPCRTVSSLMSELGHNKIDLLKIDIEGAEHEVVRSMFAQGVFPTLLCMEIDQPAPLLAIASTVRRVRNAGYRLVSVDGWNFTFVQAEALPPGTA
ncbi:FkbM family methyltransferase [Pelagibius litoralis]|uniref:FkbM family methyltransferase n=1 Tax=Pelagibius litoralis TaxID=374515 RepID=A0A967CCG5_9PROT|nr:FkbM family methyltransferase [Pelagibius litoralis]NIA69014.1 FkbM family methyltransferase [Pelagibius litoralis]